MTLLRALLHRRTPRATPVTRPANRTDKRRDARRPAGRRPGPRGFSGPGGGQAGYIAVPRAARGTTVQVCGLWPFVAGASLPSIGVPMGRRIPTPGSPSSGIVCCDPIEWYRRARLISNPSAFVLGLPGLGKSTWVRRWLIGLDDRGVLPLVLGDLKGEYVDVVRGLGGQVAVIGRGRGAINILDISTAHAAAARILDAARTAMLTGRNARAEQLRDLAALLVADARARRATMLTALLTILRKVQPEDREEALLDVALDLVDARCAARTPGAGGVFVWSDNPNNRIPLIADVLDVIREAPPELRDVAIDYGSMEKYRAVTEALEVSLTALISSNRFGGLFSRHTTPDARPRLDRPMVYDVSAIPDTERDLQAAVLLACWAEGFGGVDIAHTLADAGLEPRRNYFAVLDELWRILRAGHGMPDLIDSITRLNRSEGIGQVMVTHTMSDLELPDPADTAMARGFVERAGFVVFGGLPPAEIEKLNRVIRISDAEAGLATSWTTPPAWNSATSAPGDPPGRGNFLIKVGGRAGLPVHLDLAPAEVDWHNTAKRWEANGVTFTKREAAPAERVAA
jgi:hypothetical protein